MCIWHTCLCEFAIGVQCTFEYFVCVFDLWTFFFFFFFLLYQIILFVICLAAVAMARERFVRVAPVLKAIKSVSTATQEGKVSVLTLRLDPQHLRHRRSRCSPSYRFHAHRLRRHNK